MGVPRDDLLLMTRALKRGFADLRAIRRALDRQLFKPVTLIEALHLGPAEAESLRADRTLLDPVQDRPLLDGLREMLTAGEHLSPADWEKFAGSLARAPGRQGFGPLELPQRFDGYTLQWELARRERGVVYRARDSEGREVTIKAFRKDVPADPGLPRVEGLAYAVEPFFEGETLEGKKLTVRRGTQVIEKAARFLGDRRHGAISPARILIRRDDSVVLLGLETARRVPLSARSQAYAGTDDVHALGAILYELIVGSPPAGETSPAARTKQVDADLDRVVSSALSHAYASARDFADDLGRYLRGEPVAAPSPPAPARSPRRWIWAAAAGLAVAAAAAVAYVASRGPERGPAEAARPAPAPESRRPEPPAPPAPPPPAAVRSKPPPAPAVAPLTREDEDRLYQECVQALAGGQTDRILAIAHEALDRGSKKEWPLFHLAGAYLSRQELDKALEYVDRALARAPGNRECLEMRAQARAFRAETRKALEEFEALWGRKPADLNRQIAPLDRQIGAAPRDAQARVLRGVFYLLKRHHDTAAQDFGAAVDLGIPRALVWRAVCLREMNESSRAAADLRRYLEEFPSDFATEEARALLKDLGLER